MALTAISIVPEPDFRSEMITLIPYLRAFARALSGNRDEADDLCQETLARAWQNRSSYQMGTNLKAWLFMILRNQFYSGKRRSWRQQPWHDDAADKYGTHNDVQGPRLDLADLSRAMRLLSAEQREALILVGAGGFSYEESASICGCAIGTVKSRVARARSAIQQTLNNSTTATLGVRKDDGDAMTEMMDELAHLAPNRPALPA